MSNLPLKDKQTPDLLITLIIWWLPTVKTNSSFLMCVFGFCLGFVYVCVCVYAHHYYDHAVEPHAFQRPSLLIETGVAIARLL